MSETINPTAIVFHFRSLKEPTEQDGLTVVYNPEKKTFGVSVCRKIDHYWRKDGKNRAFERSVDSPYMTVPDDMSFDSIRLMALAIADTVAKKYKKSVVIRELNAEFRLGVPCWKAR